jgi:hypothetical protein
MTRAQAIAAARVLLGAGLTLQDVAAYLRAHPRAVGARCSAETSGPATVPALSFHCLVTWLKRLVT